MEIDFIEVINTAPSIVNDRHTHSLICLSLFYLADTVSYVRCVLFISCLSQKSTNCCDDHENNSNYQISNSFNVMYATFKRLSTKVLYYTSLDSILYLL